MSASLKPEDWEQLKKLTASAIGDPSFTPASHRIVISLTLKANSSSIVGSDGLTVLKLECSSTKLKIELVDGVTWVKAGIGEFLISSPEGPLIQVRLSLIEPLRRHQDEVETPRDIETSCSFRASTLRTNKLCHWSLR